MPKVGVIANIKSAIELSNGNIRVTLKGEKRVKYRYLIEAIAKNEKIDFTQKEAEDKAKEMAENYGITPEELIEAYGSIEVVKYDMKMHRALEILKESNK